MLGNLREGLWEKDEVVLLGEWKSPTTVAILLYKELHGGDRKLRFFSDF